MLANFHLSSITGLGLLLFCGYFCGQMIRYLKLPALIGDLTLVDILHLCAEEFLNHDSY